MSKKITPYQISKLIYKSVSQTINPNEKKVLEDWLSKKSNAKLYSKIIQKEAIRQKALLYKDSNKDVVFERIRQKIQQNQQPKLIRLKFYKIAKYAAVFIVLLGLGYVYKTQISNQNIKQPILDIQEEVITLQRENGEIEIINLNATKTVVNKNGKTIAEQQGDKITYKGDLATEDLVYNTINIPYGKKIQIELSDGTIVHLNAGSSLKYPIRFLKGLERKVFITGEAYFVVTEDKEHPFVVNTKQINVSVLGTEFNLSSYEEDADINTVLVNGKVKITNATNANTDAHYLAPGQLGAWSKNQNDFVVKNVDTEIYTGWIKGKLIFNNIPFKMIRQKLERQYNVVIINRNEALDKNPFKATFDIESIEDILETFNLNFGIEYQIIDNKIIIN